MPTVQLFATCLGDLAFPQAVSDAETLLRAAGYEVEFPARQVCCGQPAFNSGHRAAARRVARSFAKAFSREAPVVTPSGSCATMASHYLPELLGVEPFEVWELSAFLASTAFRPLPRNAGRRIAYHDSCHMLRELGISAQPRKLLGASGAELVPFDAARSVLRVRRDVLGAPAGGVAGDGRRQARRRRRGGNDRHRRPGLPHASARAGRARRVAGSRRSSRDRACQGCRCPSLGSRRAASARSRA